MGRQLKNQKPVSMRARAVDQLKWRFSVLYVCVLFSVEDFLFSLSNADILSHFFWQNKGLFLKLISQMLVY